MLAAIFFLLVLRVSNEEVFCRKSRGVRQQEGEEELFETSISKFAF